MHRKTRHHLAIALGGLVALAAGPHPARAAERPFERAFAVSASVVLDANTLAGSVTVRSRGAGQDRVRGEVKRRPSWRGAQLAVARKERHPSRLLAVREVDEDRVVARDPAADAIVEAGGYAREAVGPGAVARVGEARRFDEDLVERTFARGHERALREPPYPRESRTMLRNVCTSVISSAYTVWSAVWARRAFSSGYQVRRSCRLRVTLCLARQRDVLAERIFEVEHLDEHRRREHEGRREEHAEASNQQAHQDLRRDRHGR